MRHAPDRYDDGPVTGFLPLQLLLATFAGWVNRHEAQVMYATRSRGRPGVMKEIRQLIVCIDGHGNSSWGYYRIQGALRHLNHRVARSTIAKVLKEHDIRRSTERQMSWRTVLQSHADVVAGADFFTTEVWTVRGLVTHYTLFVIDIATRAVRAHKLVVSAAVGVVVAVCSPLPDRL